MICCYADRSVTFWLIDIAKLDKLKFSFMDSHLWIYEALSRRGFEEIQDRASNKETNEAITRKSHL